MGARQNHVVRRSASPTGPGHSDDFLVAEALQNLLQPHRIKHPQGLRGQSSPERPGKLA